MSIFNVLDYVLPNARAWWLTPQKQLREFFEGLAASFEDIRTFDENVYQDLFPQTTREIGAWESQFGLTQGLLNEQQRRDRLDAQWKALGGQSPRYIQDTLQNNGFDLYVHEWWVPGTEPPLNTIVCADARDPTALGPPSYPLVNRTGRVQPNYIVQAGEQIAQAGEPQALAGNFLNYESAEIVYEIPNDPECWRYFIYIGGEAYPALGSVPSNRQIELETLLLKICPTQLWIMVMVDYVPSACPYPMQFSGGNNPQDIDISVPVVDDAFLTMPDQCGKLVRTSEIVAGATVTQVMVELRIDVGPEINMFVHVTLFDDEGNILIDNDILAINDGSLVTAFTYAPGGILPEGERYTLEVTNVDDENDGNYVLLARSNWS